MQFADIIRKKRDGGILSDMELRFFAAGLADSSIPPEQVAALAMAIFLNSMNAAETGALTAAMARSGQSLRWDGKALGGPVVDKHSTGGIGDKVSIILAPLMAACGAYVPMVSGRGLGHTGGTMDKLSSIPGYRTMPDVETFRAVVATAGCAIAGQTEDLAPADRRLYAIRDVTATIESIPLITASILAKKMAAGIGKLVLDIKVGNGAFMDAPERARALGGCIIATAATQGLAVHALITDMNECLGTTAGNALEVAEACAYLRGDARETRLDEVCMALAAELLVLADLEPDTASALSRARKALASGMAADCFSRMVAGLGGPADLVAQPEKYLPYAKITAPVQASTNGFLAGVDARALGNAIVDLKGGRREVSDRLDLSCGFSDILATGSRVDSSRPLAVVHACSASAAAAAANAYRAACTILPDRPARRPVIYERITAA